MLFLFSSRPFSSLCLSLSLKFSLAFSSFHLSFVAPGRLIYETAKGQQMEGKHDDLKATRVLKERNRDR